MHKVYLLLRNNQQTGPYNLEELLQLQLKPFDLVWVDGRSAAWRYPGEIDALKPYVPGVPQAETPFEPIATAAMEQKSVAGNFTAPETASKKIFVSLPKSAQPSMTPPASEETVRAAFPKENPLPPAGMKDEGSLHTHYARSVEAVEEDYTKWVYEKKAVKKKSMRAKDLVVAALIVALIVAGYMIMSKPSMMQAGTAAPLATIPASPSNQQAASLPLEKPEDGAPALPETNHPSERKGKVHLAEPVKKEGQANHVPAPKQPPVQELAAVPVTAQKETPAEKKAVVIQEGETARDNGSEASVKKNKVKDFFKKVFGKKEKKEETVKEEPVAVAEDPKPASNRQATRRGEGENGGESAATASLADQVDISSNAPDNWMMGVSGLKVSLRNRSNTAVQASVNVLYYDGNDKLLDKKTIYFSRVASKGKQTVAAPDNKWADHVDFKLETVSAEDRVVQH